MSQCEYVRWLMMESHLGHLIFGLGSADVQQARVLLRHLQTASEMSFPLLPRQISYKCGRFRCYNLLTAHIGSPMLSWYAGYLALLQVPYDILDGSGSGNRLDFVAQESTPYYVVLEDSSGDCSVSSVAFNVTETLDASAPPRKLCVLHGFECF